MNKEKVTKNIINKLKLRFPQASLAGMEEFILKELKKLENED